MNQNLVAKCFSAYIQGAAAYDDRDSGPRQNKPGDKSSRWKIDRGGNFYLLFGENQEQPDQAKIFTPYARAKHREIIKLAVAMFEVNYPHGTACRTTM